MIGREIDDLGSRPLCLLDDRRAWVAGSDKAGLNLQAGLPARQLGALQHAHAELLLLLQTGLERQLVGHPQHVDRLHHRVLPDQPRRAAQRPRVDVGAEDRDERGAILELHEVRRALTALDPVVGGQIEPLPAAVDHVSDEAHDHPARADVACIDVQREH